MKTFDEVMELTRTVSSNTALEDPECQGLYDCCLQVPIGGVVIEIGCQLGRSSSVILQAAKEIGFHSYHIDPYGEGHPEYLDEWIKMARKIGAPYMFLYQTSQKAVTHVPDKVDLLFIDGDHEYAGVLSDLNLYCPKIRKGGVLAMHDYERDSLPDVYHAATEYLKDDEWDQVQVAGTLGIWRRR